MDRLLEFLDQLESRKIYFNLNRIRDSILVEIAVPGQRWEVEFFADEDIQVEKYISSGEIQGESELDVLFRDFSD